MDLKENLALREVKETDYKPTEINEYNQKNTTRI